MNKVTTVEVLIGNQSVGRLALTKEQLCVFEYDSEWLKDGFSISPLELPLNLEVKIARPEPFGGGFGVFDDSLPDGWGLLILERYLRLHHINPNELTILDRLSLVGSNGRGALEFRPDHATSDGHHSMTIQEMAKEVGLLLGSEDYTGNNLDTLYVRGGSPGGARPKVFLQFENSEWLVKFPAREDPKDIGKQEYDYSIMAKKCGIEMPDTRLFDGQYYGVKRFDRDSSGNRYHTASAAGLLCADYRIPSIDYLHLMALCRRLTNSEKDLWKLFRVATFNYAIGNKDDHAKNFSFIVVDGLWHFAPAYDLLPSYGMNGYHTTSYNNSITPTDNDVIAIAEKSGLDKKKAKTILDEIKLMTISGGSA
jgi:serine/threonine-protein kinase HipA